MHEVNDDDDEGDGGMHEVNDDEGAGDGEGGMHEANDDDDEGEGESGMHEANDDEGAGSVQGAAPVPATVGLAPLNSALALHACARQDHKE